MAQSTIDYDALAKQNGGTPSGVDYDALAKEHGGTIAAHGAPLSENAPAQSSEEPAPSAYEDIIPTAKREMSALGSALNPVSLAKGVYHAVTDEPTSTTEKVIQATTPGGLAMKRILVDPVTEAGKYYIDAAQGKHGDLSNVESEMLSVAPEAIGQAGGTVLAGKALDIAGKPVAETVRTGRLPKIADVAHDATVDVTGKTPTEIKQIATAPIRGAGKAINAGKAVVPYVAPIAGAAEGYARGGIPGAGIGLLSGGTASRFLKAIPDVPESVTRYGLPKIATEEGAPIERDATNQNEPYAGEEDLIPSKTTPIERDATRQNEPYAGEEDDLIPSKTAASGPLGSALPKSTSTPSGEPEPAPKQVTPKAVPSESAPKPTLDPTKERNLRHMLGDYAMDELSKTKEGVAAAQQLSNGSYRDYADLASYEGVLKPKSLAEKTGKEWTADDFKRSVAQHGKELAPNKELVLRHLVDRYEPQEILERTEGWGKSVAEAAPEFSPETQKLVTALGVSDEGKSALSKLNLDDANLQKYLIKLDTRDLDRLADGKLPRRRIRK